MPNVSSKRKPTFRKKTQKYNRRPMFNRKKTNIFGAMSSGRITAEPFPGRMYTRARYSDYHVITATALANLAESKVYRINSIYDPQYALGGNTVTGYAQLAAIYSRYLVTKVRFQVAFYDPSSDGVRVGLRIRTKDALPSQGETNTQLMAQPMTYTAGLANSGKQRKMWSLTIYPWTLMGLSKLEYFSNMSQYSSAMGANPEHDALVDVFAVNQTGSDISLQVNVNILYDLQLYDRKALVPSGPPGP